MSEKVAKQQKEEGKIEMIVAEGRKGEEKREREERENEGEGKTFPLYPVKNVSCWSSGLSLYV